MRHSSTFYSIVFRPFFGNIKIRNKMFSLFVLHSFSQDPGQRDGRNKGTKRLQREFYHRNSIKKIYITCSTARLYGITSIYARQPDVYTPGVIKAKREDYQGREKLPSSRFIRTRNRRGNIGGHNNLARTMRSSNSPEDILPAIVHFFSLSLHIYHLIRIWYFAVHYVV